MYHVVDLRTAAAMRAHTHPFALLSSALPNSMRGWIMDALLQP